MWIRQDLRLADNPALAAAAARGPVVPLFILAPDEEGEWPPGAASRWWLDRSLRALEATLCALGSRLVVRRGPSLDVLHEVARECSATRVVWNRRYEPASIARDRTVKQGLRADGLEAASCNSSLLLEPWENGKDDGTPYRVFTPFWKAMLRRAAVPAPLPSPARLDAPTAWPRSDSIDDLGLLPRIDWAAGMREAWTPGETGAHAALGRFLRDGIASYESARDVPSRTGTSRLSPHLHFGEIGPRQVWHAVRDLAAERADPRFDAAADAWLRQIAWREFGHHLLYHFPRTPTEPLRPEFARFEWSDDDELLAKWQRGLTGYPIVDAGMRELWRTGWMHNRVRMIVASFLVKDLRLPWQEGARWFWDTLVDADLASNTLNWQWAAGCGADAAPYFRIFNPVLQGRKFDPAGEYVRRHVTELRDHSARTIHSPWESGDGARGYPPPMVDHKQAREEALAAYEAVRRG